MNYPVGASRVSVDVRVVDDDSLPVLSLRADTFPPVFVSPGGTNSNVSITLSDLAEVLDPHPDDDVAGGLFERGGGLYRLDYPNNLFAAAAVLTTVGEASGLHLRVDTIQVAGVLGAGNGPFRAIVAVQDSVSLAGVPGAVVRLTAGLAVFIQTTDQYGMASFSLDANTYQADVTAPGYVYPGGCFTVSDDGTFPLPVTAVAAPPPDSPPGQATGTLTCYDETGAAAEGVSITVALVAMPLNDVGSSAPTTTRTQVSAADGTVAFTGLWRGATYQARRGVGQPAGTWFEFVVPISDDASFAMPDVVGYA